MPNQSMLAHAFIETYRYGDSELRTDLEIVIRRIVVRNRALGVQLQQAIKSYPPIGALAPGLLYELAAACSMLWHFADAALRAEVEALLRDLVRRRPTLLPALRAIDAPMAR